jgi:GNAT superfamily N-acetyltransferase
LNTDIPPAPRIISAGEEDLRVIAELAGLVWRACYPGIISQAQIEYMLARMYALDTLREELRSQEIRYHLLLVNAKLVGFASYGPAFEPKTMKLHKLYLLPEWHRRGLGSLLLQHVEGEAFATGANRLTLSVNKRNAQAISAYHRNGFVVVDSCVTDIGGGFIMDDYVMAKELTSDSAGKALR